MLPAVAEKQDLKPLVCLVCGRASNTGHHYGVTACLGCKTFFRRVVIQGRSPKCKVEGSCPLQKGKGTRRICRSCRYEKCKEIGMKEEALHPCRDLIGKRKESVSDSGDEVQLPSSTTADVRLSPVEEEALGLVQEILEADSEIRAGTSRADAPDDPPLNDDLPATLREDFSRLHQWTEKVADFIRLSPSTKKCLLHKFCLGHTVLESALLTSRLPAQNNLWFLSDGTCVVRDFKLLPKCQASSQTAMEHRLLLPLTELILQDVTEPMRKLQLSDEEVAGLKSLMLMKPAGLSRETSAEEDRTRIQQFRDRVLRGLHAHYLVRGEEHPERRLAELVLLTGSIEICAGQCLEYMHMLRFFNLGTFDPDSELLIFGP